jgi:hypothetical protein
VSFLESRKSITCQAQEKYTTRTQASEYKNPLKIQNEDMEKVDEE